MAIIMAVIILLLVVMSFFISASIFIQNQSKFEDSTLNIKYNRLKNTTIIWDDLIQISERSRYLEVIKDVLTDALVMTNSWEIIHPMSNAPDLSDIPFDTITTFWKYKYLKRELSYNWRVYTLLVRSPTVDLSEKMKLTLFAIIFGIPLLFVLLVFISYRIMGVVYHPIRDVISSLEEYGSNINHEFKTSLTEILTSLELAKITNDYKDGVNQAITSSKRLSSILDSLGHMIYFVNSEYRRANINIVSVLDKSIGEFDSIIKQKKITIIKKYNPEKSIYTNVDIQPLELVFRNILKNAIRYSHEGGIIDISITGNTFTIKDYGVGIEKENLLRVFDRHFRENYSWEWSGIGLSLVKKLTNTYNWDLEFDSKIEEFTEVTIRFL